MLNNVIISNNYPGGLTASYASDLILTNVIIYGHSEFGIKIGVDEYSADANFSIKNSIICVI